MCSSLQGLVVQNSSTRPCGTLKKVVPRRPSKELVGTLACFTLVTTPFVRRHNGGVPASVAQQIGISTRTGPAERMLHHTAGAPGSRPRDVCMRCSARGVQRTPHGPVPLPLLPCCHVCRRRRCRPQPQPKLIISLLLPLQNPTDERIAFKVKTTAPAKYSVHPALTLESVCPLLRRQRALPVATCSELHQLGKPPLAPHVLLRLPIPCRPSPQRGCWSHRPASSWQSPAAPPSSCQTGWPTARWVAAAGRLSCLPAAKTACVSMPFACGCYRCHRPRLPPAFHALSCLLSHAAGPVSGGGPGSGARGAAGQL
jgi:hypothetical protein